MAAFAGCSSSEEPAGGGTDSGSVADAGARSDAGSSDGAVSASDASSSGDAGTHGDGGGLVVITGVVSNLTQSGNIPLSAATVEIVGVNPANATTSGTDGTYSLTVLPGTHFVRASKSNMFSAQVGVVTSASTVVNELGLLDVSSAVILAKAVRQTVEEGKGILGVMFLTDDTGGDYGASLGSGITHDEPITLAAGGIPQRSDKTVKGGKNVLFFLNVAPAPGRTTATFVAPTGRTCTASPPTTEYRIDADVVTGVVASCN